MWLSDWLGSVPGRRLLGVPVIGICTMVSSPFKRMLLMGFLACVLLGHASAFEVEFYPLSIAPPTTNGAEARRISIAQFINELPRRNVYLKAESTMVKDHSHTVKAGLTLGDTQALFANMNGPGKLTVIDSVPVAPEMSATLSGDGFQFPSGSPPRQFVDPAKPTVWSWQVVPRRTGQLKLLLRVSVIVTMPGVNVESEYQVKEEEITVIVGLRGWLERIGSIIWAGLRWFLAAVGVLAMPAVWKHLKRRFRRSRKKKIKKAQAGNGRAADS